MEFAIILPVFALMLFGMIQFGLVFNGWTSLHNSVQTGARLAAIDDLGDYGSCGAACTCPALTEAEEQPPLPPVIPNDGTAATYCEIAELIGSPAGTSADPTSTTNSPEIGISVATDSAGNEEVTVCGVVPAQLFTGFLPHMNLSSASEFLIEDTGSSPLATYNPYDLSACS